MTLETLKLDAIDRAPVKRDPYPYFMVDQVFSDTAYDRILADFPAITQGGSFALSQLDYGEAFTRLIEELDSPEFRRVIEQKFNIDLSGRPMVVTARGVSRPKDGRIHTDSKSKLVTILIYMNPAWEADTGKLRILDNDSDLASYCAEVPPTAGSLVAFQVTENCWHGYRAFDGVRRSIQINYVADEAAVKKHQSRHGFTARLKALKQSLFG